MGAPLTRSLLGPVLSATLIGAITFGVVLAWPKQPSSQGVSHASPSTPPSPPQTAATASAHPPSSPPAAATPTPRVLPPAPPTEAELRTRAQGTLDAWAEFLGEAPPETIVVTTQLTTLDHGWKGPNGDNDKSAFLSGLIETRVDLPTQAPPPAQITWPDGSQSVVELQSAAAALDAIRAEGDGGCDGCTPVHIVDVRLTTHAYDTTRGRTDLPAWEFTLKEGNVHVYRVATRHALVVAAEDSAPSLLAVLTEDDPRLLTVQFMGSACSDPDDALAVAVESDTAVVVFLTVREYATPDPMATPAYCSAAGVIWPFTVELDAPLGARAVLDISGVPVLRDPAWRTE